MNPFAKKSKFKAVKVFRYGRNWPSKLELSVYETLLMMERGGLLKDVKCQVKVSFHTHDYGYIHMIPDFSAFNLKENELQYFEAKGFKTREWARKRKAWMIGGPGKLHVYEGNWQYPKLVETIVPKGEANGEA